jgi:hypothetical protein
MPHSFKPYPKHPAVAYLIRLHADIGGRILDNKRQAERLAADAPVDVAMPGIQVLWRLRHNTAMMNKISYNGYRFPRVSIFPL